MNENIYLVYNERIELWALKSFSFPSNSALSESCKVKNKKQSP